MWTAGATRERVFAQVWLCPDAHSPAGGLISGFGDTSTTARLLRFIGQATRAIYQRVKTMSGYCQGSSRDVSGFCNPPYPNRPGAFSNSPFGTSTSLRGVTAVGVEAGAQYLGARFGGRS